MKEILYKIIYFVMLVLACATPGFVFQKMDPERLGGYTAFGISFTIFVTALSLWPMLDKPRMRALFYGSMALGAGIFIAFIDYKFGQIAEAERPSWVMLLPWAMWMFVIGGAISIVSYGYANREDRAKMVKDIVATVATTTGALVSFILGVASALSM